MCAIIRYNQKRIIQNFENFIFHVITIGVIYGVWSGKLLELIVEGTCPAKNSIPKFTMILQTTNKRSRTCVRGNIIQVWKNL